MAKQDSKSIEEINTLFRINRQQAVLARWLKVYMDDLLIANEGDCLDIIKKALIVLKLLKENDLFVKPEKCSFFVTSVDFQGSKGLYRGWMDQDGSNHTQRNIGLASSNHSNTSSAKFYQFCNFYHCFFDHYSDKCAPLNLLL
jgi:hypothetical protein